MAAGKHREWTLQEDDLLRDLYGNTIAKEIAKRLDRSKLAVFQRARLLGLNASRVLDEDKITKLRQMSSAGLTDRDIALSLGVAVRTVWRRRKEMLLPSNVFGERHLDNLKEAIKRRSRSCVWKEGQRKRGREESKVTRQARERFAAKNGWPIDLHPKCVIILNLLSSVGMPMTRYEICDSLALNLQEFGRLWRPVLIRNGLIDAARGRRRGKGNTPSTGYELGPAAFAILEERARCEMEEKKSKP